MHLLKWLYPGMRFKRWLLLFAAGVLLIIIGLTIVFNYKYIDGIEEFIFRIVYTTTGTYNYTVTNTANGCVRTGSQAVTQDLAQPSASSSA